ncbi:MAG: AAA family ATPase [Candidatus Bathyarchaeia archaeon]
MRIKVSMENVGGLKGLREFEFIKGAINIVKAPNAAGKSTLIKAITLCLSYPYESDVLLEIARDIGLLRQLSERVDPLIHIDSDFANITVRMNGKIWGITLSKGGKPKLLYEKGDERFLVTSVITRESKILRNLIVGKTDFKWLIDNVSKAKNYDAIATVLDEERLKFEEMLYQIDIRRKEARDIMERIKEISKAIDSYITREQMLNKRLSEVLAKHPEVTEWRERRDLLLVKIRQIEDEIKEKETIKEEDQKKLDKETREHREKIDRRDRLRKILAQKINEMERIKEQIKEIDENLKDYEEKIKELHEQEVELRVEEGKALAQIDIYENALKIASAMPEKKTLCFLCKQGYLTLSSLEQSKLLAENSLREIRNKIADLLSKRNRLYFYRNEKERLKKELEKLDDEISSIRGELDDLERSLENYERNVKAYMKRIQECSKILEKLRSDIAQSRKEIENIDKLIGMLGEEEKNLTSEISEIRGKISLMEEQKTNELKKLEEISYVEINNMSFSLEEAYKLLSSWLKALREIYTYLSSEARKERIAAVEIFNSHVKNVLKETAFEYLDVWIDPKDYKLYMRDLRSNNEISPRILSETEKYVLSFVIHIALKLSYTPHIPLLLVDEVALSFDEKRKYAMLKYLLDLAKENNWAVILTELGYEDRMTIQTIKDL